MTEMINHYRYTVFFLFLILNFYTFVFSEGLPAQYSLIADERSENQADIIDSIYNRYSPNGNITILVAVDSNLIGTNKYFSDKTNAQAVFNGWLVPFEIRFNISFHVLNVTTFIPGEKDSLDISIIKVAEYLSWNFADTQDDPLVDGNKYDFLIIYQEKYEGGRNRANSVNGNALIIAHEQPGYPFSMWTSRQLILLHEVGHIFGGEHYDEGIIPPEWFGSSELSIMSYDNLSTLKSDGWDPEEMPIDDHNFAIINSSKYRFDRNDADLDSLPNYYEFRYEMDPTSDDTLQDLEDDGMTNIEEYISGTHPRLSDTDGDLFSDWAENLFGSSPLNLSDLPTIPEPVIFPQSEDQSIFHDQTINIKWRAVAQIKDSYSIYTNDSLIKQVDWDQEIIQYTFVPQTKGNWEITCAVTDDQGLSVQSSVWIEVINEESPGIIPFIFPWFSLLFLMIIIKIRANKKI
ncbi:hypothetical protein CEE45_10090 [Candidatus Heimdallarchaeota archaeon B3_Heim]|nr:MAG: hypothetical protein CEE45_10090 [Candidatus Heimdallarchaeota archaeon B3_Heim]